MASNFKISLHRNSNTLRLMLTGDFDGSSAMELINVLKAHSARAAAIVVHTCGLSSVHPFGLDVFHKSYSGARLTRNLKFTGKHGDTITP